MTRRIINRPVLLALIVSAVALVPASLGCQGVVGSGTIVTETRELTEFDEIELRIAGDVHVAIGAPTPLTITADDNIAPLITTEVLDRRLIISSEKNFRCKKSPKLTVTIADLKAADLRGSGDMKIDGVSNDALSLSISGSGDMICTGTTKLLTASVAGSGDLRYTGQAEKASANVAGSGDVRLSGSGDSLTVAIAGSGDVYAFEFTTSAATVAISGSGDARVNASQTLKAEVRGSGDAHYKGSPTITKTIVGSGVVKQHK